MPRYSVPLTTYASTSVEIDAPDDATPEQIAELALEHVAYEGGPTLCHHCTNSRNGGGLELGDEWEPVLDNGQPVVTALDGDVR
ncbi:hypothetical protein [Kitasatospora sp. NPDC051164]|uniref:hypothetical protein n=1 Tax=Kitasatospora sp. NPDC051164 TaxID=3364055 RepID=UPI00379908F0